MFTLERTDILVRRSFLNLELKDTKIFKISNMNIFSNIILYCIKNSYSSCISPLSYTVSYNILTLKYSGKEISELKWADWVSSELFLKVVIG